MDYYAIMFANVSALLCSYGIKLQYVHYNRRVDEYGNVGHGCPEDDIIEYLDAGDLRLIVRQCSDRGDRWFDIEIGEPREKAESLSWHDVRIRFNQCSSEAEIRPPMVFWSMVHIDSPEAAALLQKIDPKLAELCSEKDGNVYHMPESFDQDISNKAFFFAAIDNVFRVFAEAIKSQAATA